MIQTDKESVKIDDLITSLRMCAGGIDCGKCIMFEQSKTSFCPTMLMEKTADVLEQYRRSGKFHAFIWNTLGHATMMQLVELYREQEGEQE